VFQLQTGRQCPGSANHFCHKDVPGTDVTNPKTNSGNTSLPNARRALVGAGVAHVLEKCQQLFGFTPKLGLGGLPSTTFIVTYMIFAPVFSR
jgi:hypothetical protein